MPVDGSEPTTSASVDDPSGRRTRQRSGSRRRGLALVRTIPSSRTTTPEPPRLDGDDGRCHLLTDAVGGLIGGPRGGRDGVEGHALDHGTIDDPLPETERQHPRAGEDGTGGAGGGHDTPGTTGRAITAVDPAPRPGPKLRRVTPQPIVGVGRRTEPEEVRFGVVVEGHGAEDNSGWTARDRARPVRACVA